MENSRVKVQVSCPFCGLLQTAYVQASRIGVPNIVTCDCEHADGCDRIFVVDVKITYVATSYKVERPQGNISHTIIS